MKISILLLTVLLMLTSCTQEQTTTPLASTGETVSHADHVEKTASGSNYISSLDASPRHQEWVVVKNGEKNIHTWVVYPQNNQKSKVVVLIHENKGLTDWVRNLADQVAAEGYIAIAPDLLSDFSDTQKKTSDFASEDAAREAISKLDKNAVLKDLEAVVQYTKTIETANGKIVSAGFCWGGSQSFSLATISKDLSAAMVFYGSGPANASDYTNISVPVYGFYAGNDDRINATIPNTEKYMSTSGKKYDYMTYPGAGHAFMRLGEGQSAEDGNKEARDASWKRMKEILEQM